MFEAVIMIIFSLFLTQFPFSPPALLELHPLFPLETSSCVYYGQIAYFQNNKWWGGGVGGWGGGGVVGEG